MKITPEHIMATWAACAVFVIAFMMWLDPSCDMSNSIVNRHGKVCWDKYWQQRYTDVEDRN